MESEMLVWIKQQNEYNNEMLKERQRIMKETEIMQEEEQWTN